jgi:tRNA A-37 threonylcarbamoyl transferase component Bud32
MGTERDLLVGLLALETGAVNAAQFLDAYRHWANRQDTDLGELLVRGGALTADVRTQLQHLVDERHLASAAAAVTTPVPDHTNAEAPAQDQGTSCSEMVVGWPGLSPRSPGPPRRGFEDSAPATPPQPQGMPLGPALAPGSCGDVQATVRCDVRPARHVLLSTLNAGPPSTGGRYTLNRLHGQGGNGQVWLAFDTTLGREVALKSLRAEVVGNPAVYARFLREARVTGRLEHPGIVPVYELSTQAPDQPPFFTMRFLRGRTLSDAVRLFHERRRAGQAGPPELHRLLSGFVTVCNTIAYAHARGVIHRDLKGQNIVLGDYGEVMVLDWGEAKVVGDAVGNGPDVPDRLPAPVSLLGTSPAETVQGDVIGTPAYMSPEQARGRADEVDARTDVYGLGAVLYELLTGQPPFLAADVKEVLRRVSEEPPEPPRRHVPETPPALEAICLKALAKKPGTRYATAGDLGADVQRWLADDAVSVYRDSWTVQAGRWLKRHRIGVTGFVAGTVAFVCLAAATLLLSAANQRQRLAEAAAARSAAEVQRLRTLLRSSARGNSVQLPSR